MSNAPRDTKWRSALDRLRRADQLARAAPARILLAGLLVDLARRRRTANRAGMRELVGHGVGRALVHHHADDLRDDVPCPLDDHRVADADVVAFADRLAVAVHALDVVLVVQRDVLDHDAADRDRRQPRHRRQRAGAADLDVDLAHRGRRLLGREFVGDRPARLAGHETPAPLQIEPGRPCRRRRRCRSRATSAAPRSACSARSAPRPILARIISGLILKPQSPNFCTASYCVGAGSSVV